jgi:hypothetical protein
MMSAKNNPAPLSGGHQAQKNDFVDHENQQHGIILPLFRQARHGPLPTQIHSLFSLLATVPDENLTPLICRHWPTTTRQEVIQKIAIAEEALEVLHA